MMQRLAEMTAAEAERLKPEIEAAQAAFQGIERSLAVGPNGLSREAIAAALRHAEELADSATRNIAAFPNSYAFSNAMPPDISGLLAPGPTVPFEHLDGVKAVTGEEKRMDAKVTWRYLDGWEPVSPVERLGSGRQGSVYKVRSPEAYKKRHALADQIRQAANRLAGNDPQDSAFKLAEALAGFNVVDDEPEHLGAAKLFEIGPGPDGERDFARLKTEVAVLQESKEPGLLQLLHANLEKRFFVTRYYPRTLARLLEEQPEIYKNNVAATLLAIRPVVAAVAWLHEKKPSVIHRDIKTDNMFIDEKGMIVLGDFGIAIQPDGDEERLTELRDRRPKGTRDWMAPWAYKGAKRIPIEEIDGSFDTFSLGKVIWVMLSGEPVLPHWLRDDDEDTNLEKLFPENPDTVWVNGILRSCVVGRRNECLLDTGGKLLKSIDQTVERLEGRNEVLDASLRRLSRPCRICRRGEYVIEAPARVQFAGKGFAEGFTCTQCGHIEFFRVTSEGFARAWNPRQA